MKTLNQYLEYEYENGRGVAAIDADTDRIITPYLGSEYGGSGWDTPSDLGLDGNIEYENGAKFRASTGVYLVSHSGGLEDDWRANKKYGKNSYDR